MKISYRIIKYSIVASFLLTGCATHNSTNNLNRDPFIGYLPSTDLNSYVPLDLLFTEKEKPRTLEDNVREMEVMFKQFEEWDRMALDAKLALPPVSIPQLDNHIGVNKQDIPNINPCDGE